MPAAQFLSRDTHPDSSPLFSSVFFASDLVFNLNNDSKCHVTRDTKTKFPPAWLRRSTLTSVNRFLRESATASFFLPFEVVAHAYGNDTTFQSFPLDLQNYLSARVPSHLDVKIHSTIYPTYKSVRPLSYATKNFLEWLQYLPQGPVILLGHSMGGLLAAEAATDPINVPNERTGKPRIVAVVDFDTPFLGMHPHVIISGIASLLPNRKAGRKKESEMNRHPDIDIVPERVTDDWEDFKRSAGARPENSWSGTETLSPMTTSSSAFSQHLTPPPRSPSPFFDRVLGLASTHSDWPFIRRLKNHSDHPVSSGKQWIVEHLQFGGAMFDSSGLKERYRRLVAWKDGTWINYWTTTCGGTSSEEGLEAGQLTNNDHGLLESGIIESSAPGTPTSLIDQEWRNYIKKSNETSRKKRGRHFIVLPTGLGKILGGERCWEKVVIRGVEDEVAAHCGIFIREHNLDYDGFLGRVGTKIIQLCEVL